MNKFQNDLNFSRYYELELLKHVTYNTYVQAPDEVFYDYDIKVYLDDKTEITYEVKSDRWANKTGNICIEYQRTSGKKSGISTSKATNYAIFCIDDLGGYELFIIPRKTLKQMINNQEFIANKQTNDGSCFVLFKKNQIKTKAILHKSIY